MELSRQNAQSVDKPLLCRLLRRPRTGRMFANLRPRNAHTELPKMLLSPPGVEDQRKLSRGNQVALLVFVEDRDEALGPRPPSWPACDAIARVYSITSNPRVKNLESWIVRTAQAKSAITGPAGSRTAGTGSHGAVWAWVRAHRAAHGRPTDRYSTSLVPRHRAQRDRQGRKRTPLGAE